MLQPGSVIDERYEILDRLDAGGVGEVYRARHVHLEELRAIKVLPRRWCERPELVDRFRSEALRSKGVRHPRVAQLYDFSRLDDGSRYMVWEFVSGRGLLGCLREGHFPIALAVELVIEALEGLEALHAAGVVHGRIRPSSLRLTFDERGRPSLSIIDFGLPRDLRRFDEASSLAREDSTEDFAYCSPEAAGLFDTVDGRSDLYSLMLVLYEMIAGRRAFDPVAMGAGLYDHFLRGPASIREAAPIEVDRELAEIVHRAIAFDPDERFASAPELSTALREVLPRLPEHRLSAQRESAEAVARRGVQTRVSAKQRELQTAHCRLMVDRHLACQEPILAGIALERLVELQPDHPDRRLLEEGLSNLTARVFRERQGSSLLERARQQLDRGDVERARETMERARERAHDRQAAVQLAQQIARADAEQDLSSPGSELPEVKATLLEGAVLAQSEEPPAPVDERL